MPDSSSKAERLAPTVRRAFERGGAVSSAGRFLFAAAIVAALSCRTRPRIVHEAAVASSEAVVEIEVPASVDLRDLEIEVGQCMCALGLTIPEGEAGAGSYFASCGGYDHGSNPVYRELASMAQSAVDAAARGERVLAVIGVNGDEIRSIRWWIEAP
jgi:hypothetical protein